jgi:hypothetical protein
MFLELNLSGKRSARLGEEAIKYYDVSRADETGGA